MKKEFGRRKTSPFRDTDLVQYLSHDGKQIYRNEVVTLGQLKTQIGPYEETTYSFRRPNNTFPDASYFLVYPNILAYPPDTGYPTADPTLDDIKEAIKINQASAVQWALTAAAEECNATITDIQRAVSTIEYLQQEATTLKLTKDNEHDQHKQDLERLIDDINNTNSNPPAWLTEQINVSPYLKELEAFDTWKAEDSDRYAEFVETFDDLKEVYQYILDYANDICQFAP
jgi:FtsZ-binding cell division protein ZapB